MTGLTDRIALVVGASGALGTALVGRLLSEGAQTETLDRSPERTARRHAEAVAAGRLTCHGVDLADAEAVAELVGAIAARCGRIDHLFCVAGGFAADGPVEATPLETWQRMLDGNFRSTLHACRAVVPVMKRQGAGTIVNVGSRAALAGGADVAAYSVAKAAVVRLTESLAAEGRRRGVRVNCVLPGTMDTAANREAMPDADPSLWVPLEAMVDVLLFLSSPAARAVHGAALPVFGLE